uniref:ATP-binding cassette domain-containing protein n=1 Tax=Roseihalotalea indica TaxID=2867963 RepID=A0AA49JB85_9BACT|nr:ATP-binding cassette domain-containing protein [Tunicatimonas sp. TK19036]
MIEVKNICKNYGQKRVVDNVSFQVSEGQTLVLLGTSGSGKTTLLKMINRLIIPASGSIVIDGKNTAEINPSILRKKIGYVIQQVGLFPHYTILENIGLILQLEGWPDTKRVSRSKEMLKLVGLEESYGSRYPHELSGGQQQRIGLARAMANNPPLILMDEPFGALDPITKQNLIEELKVKKIFIEKTIIMVTHDVFEAITLGDKICLLDKGQIKQIGTPKEMLFQPQSSFVKEFFDAQRFRLELRITTLEEILVFISPFNISSEGACEVGLHQSVWEVLEQAERNNQASVSITDRSEVISVTTPEALVSAFYQYKKQWKT